MCPSTPLKCFNDSDIFKVYLSIENTSFKDSPLPALQTPVRQDGLLNTSLLYELPPLFSCINFRAIEMLSVTQHGEFMTRSKQGKHETIVELSGHISQRCGVTKKELEEIQKIYEQIIETWILWRVTHKKT